MMHCCQPNSLACPAFAPYDAAMPVYRKMSWFFWCAIALAYGLVAAASVMLTVDREPDCSSAECVFMWQIQSP